MHLEERSRSHPALGSLAIALACLLGSMELLGLAAAIEKFVREGGHAGVVTFLAGVVSLVVVGVAMAIWSAWAYLNRGTRGWPVIPSVLFLVLMLFVSGYIVLASAG